MGKFSWINVWISIWLICLMPNLSLGQASSTPASLVARVDLKDYRIQALQISELKINLTVAPGFKAYEDKFKVRIMSPNGFQTAGFQINPLIEFYDKFSKKKKRGIVNNGVITLPFEAPKELTAGNHELVIELGYQACTDSFCEFPKTLELKVPFEFKGIPQEVLTLPEARYFLPTNFKEAFQQGVLWTFVFVFFAGVLTSFTPCIFPMIPITLTVLGRNAHTRTRSQNFFVSVMYVLGISVTYSFLGLLAASTGALFGSFMSHPIVLSVMCFVFLAMALSMFGLFEIHAPAFIENRFATTEDLKGYSGAFFSGIVAGVVASPCVGPVLVGILTFIAKSQNLWLGFFLMFIYALGMGQIFLVLGGFSQMIKLLPKSGPWLDGVKNLFGILMLGVFYYFLSLLLPQKWWDISLGIGLAATAGYLNRLPVTAIPWRYIRRSLLQVAIIVGSIYIVVGVFDLRPFIQNRFIEETTAPQTPELNWLQFSEEALANAKVLGKPVLVDFHADWCAACKELDQYTFTKSRFQMMAQNFILMKFDATSESPQLEIYRNKYDIVGLPTLLFFDSRGEWRKDLTLTAFEEVDPLVERMSKVLK